MLMGPTQIGPLPHTPRSSLRALQDSTTRSLPGYLFIKPCSLSLSLTFQEPLSPSFFLYLSIHPCSFLLHPSQDKKGRRVLSFIASPRLPYLLREEGLDLEAAWPGHFCRVANCNMAALRGAAGAVLALAGRALNDVVSFLVFTLLDVFDVVLCLVFKVVDFIVEAEWRPCYCSAPKEAIMSSGKILVSEQGKSKIVCLCSSKLQLEDISDTLYKRPSLVSDVMKLRGGKQLGAARNVMKRSTVTINSTIVEMLQAKMGGQHSHPVPRWSDCDCKICAGWSTSTKDTLFVRSEGSEDKAKEDVLFIHGFISSSAFWTETLFPNFSEEAKSKYRLLAVDLLGFGRSPKPTDSFYTLREHVDMIERSVLEAHKVESFHIVAHSLGCILALAIAVKHPHAVKSLTLLAPIRTVQIVRTILYAVVKGSDPEIIISRNIAAIFSGAEWRAGVSIRAKKSGPKTRVAVDCIRRIDRLLVRAHQSSSLLGPVQKSSAVGVHHQASHAEQVMKNPQTAGIHPSETASHIGTRKRPST
ncbi:hypothetical protein ACLOJK_004865 [Asimina triloba]